MPRASEIKKGFAIESNGKTLLVKDIEVTTPGGRGGTKIYKMRCFEIATGVRVDERFKADEVVDTVDMFKRQVSFSYVDGDEYIFMDTEDYTQYTFKAEELEDELTPEIRDLGYESHNELVNLGSVFLMVMFYFMLVLLYFTLKSLMKHFNKYWKVVARISSRKSLTDYSFF